MAEFAELKTKQKATWALGEYDAVAQGLHLAQDHVIRVARPRPGQTVLDVATGTGNTALKARELGAKVTGLDFTPELLAVARRKAEAMGLPDVRFDEGDAGKLPYRDGEFDLVLSTCGHMFAPDQEQVGREMVRVTKPGGRIVFMAWTPDGGVGGLFRTMNRHLPPPPGVPSPFAWGVRENVQRLLPGTRDLRFEEGDCVDVHPSAEAAARQYREKYGPTTRAFSAVGDAAKQDALWDDLVRFYQGYVTPVDGKVRWGREYLLTVATKA
jgi:ubiquinone/menaquinone biosynthesis C-methylase UbiE